MEAHAEDLRAEVQDRADGNDIVEAMRRDHGAATLSQADHAMLYFAVKLTKDPKRMRPEDLEPLKRQGFDDAAIHDIVQVTALFNYYNRLADGLGIDPEP